MQRHSHLSPRCEFHASASFEKSKNSSSWPNFDILFLKLLVPCDGMFLVSFSSSRCFENHCHRRLWSKCYFHTFISPYIVSRTADDIFAPNFIHAMSITSSTVCQNFRSWALTTRRNSTTLIYLTHKRIFSRQILYLPIFLTSSMVCQI